MIRKFKKTKKTQQVRIVITQETKEKLQEIRQKYKVSLSTLTEKIANSYLLIPQETKENLKKVYLFKNGKETYIKPRNILNPIETKEQKTKYLSNLLYLYANKELNKLLPNQKAIEKANTKLNNELNNAKECYWDLNNTIRTQKRALRILGATK